MAQPELEAIAASLSLAANLPTNGAALADRLSTLEQRSNASDRVIQNLSNLLEQMQSNHLAMMEKIDTVHRGLDQKIDTVHRILDQKIDTIQRDLTALYAHVYLLGTSTKLCAETPSDYITLQLPRGTPCDTRPVS